MNEVTYTCRMYDDDGEFIGENTTVFYTEGFLPDMLYNFKSFLQGAGYNYVDNVYCIDNHGSEHGEE